MLTIQFLCPLPNGLHARPAWELKEQCSQWQSEVTFIYYLAEIRHLTHQSLTVYSEVSGGGSQLDSTFIFAFCI